MLLVFTPLRKIVPGYGQVKSNEEFIALVRGVDELSERMEDQDRYLKALRKLMISGGDTSTVVERREVVANMQDRSSKDDSPENPAVYSKSQETHTALSDIEVNRGDADALWRTLSKDVPRSPLEGIISSEFDPSSKHFGVDVLAPANTPITAILDGYVISSGWDLETGYTLGIQHDGEILSFYKHNSVLLKEKGTFVSAGEAIAIIGNTGTLSSGPHLHFEFWHHGKPINPKDIINFE